MSRINDLIQKYCADGVEYKQIKEIANVYIGEFVRKDKQSENGRYPVYNGGISNTGYYDEYNMTANKVIMSARGANAGFVNKVTTDFWAGNSCYCIEVDKSKVMWNYLYYILKNDEKSFIANQQTASIPAVSKAQVEKHRIPIPPLAVQEEIVRILDTFTEYQNELQNELQGRKEQYNQYRYRLFSFDNTVERKRINEICEVVKGKTPIQKAVLGEYPLVVTTSERKSSNQYQFDTSAVCIPLVSSRGHGIASLNHVYYQEGKFALGNILCAVIPFDLKAISTKYLYYYFEETKDNTIVPLMKGGANVALHMEDINRIKVPIPSFAEQERIVKILDSFDSYCNDLSQGLPKEIELRQRQYEYYRDKLLTFKEKTA